jgi:hypothetical protein
MKAFITLGKKISKRARLVLITLWTLLTVFGVAGLSPAAGLSGPIFDQPVLITCIGQSADGQMVRVLAERVKLDHKYDPAADASAMSSYKTLVLVLGGSSKGLGAAGIKPAQEEARGQALVAAAKGGGAKIMVMHVGGEARRGELTDPSIKSMAPAADYIIVVADGDKDKIFEQVAGKTPIDLPETMGEVGRLLKAAFR